MAPGTLDYAASYFKYKIPTPIRGEPDHKSLKRLKKELRSNASSVETDLGGGNHGYLGLLKKDEDYNATPDTQPFLPPTCPSPLTISQDSTPTQALELKEQHKEQKRLYLECKNVEKALLRHVQEAIEDCYIEPLVNEYTNLLTHDIPAVLEYLTYNFGKVRSEEVTEKEIEVMAMSWQPQDSLVLLTKPIENLQSLAKEAGIPYSDMQLLHKGLTIARNTRDFEYALTMWETLLEEDKTWLKFKTHFHEAQLALKRIRCPTMQQAGYHHANSLVMQIRSDMQENMQTRDIQMLAMLNAVTPPPSDSCSTSGTSDTSQTSEINHTANYTTDQTQLEILKLLKELSQSMKNNRPQRRFGRKAPDNKVIPPRNDLSKHCWTHGKGNHSSAECRIRA